MAEDDPGQRRRAQIDAWWRGEPLGFESRAGSGRRRFEFSSRGDRVEGWLRPAEGPARPLILVVPGSSAGAADPSVADWAEQWLQGGAAVACLDLPLHGVRTSAKLSAALVDAASDLPRLERDADRERLVAEFLLQCRWDLRGALEGLCARPEIDAKRVACVGVGLGALACLHACDDRRVNAGVFVDAPAGGPVAIDGSNALARFSRPALAIEAPEAKGLSGNAQRLVLPGVASDLARLAWPFLSGALALSPQGRPR